MVTPPSGRHDAHVLALGIEFMEQAQRAATPSEFMTLMEAITPEIGFERFAVIEHVDLSQPTPGIVNFNTYPDAWTDLFIHQRFFLEDPMVHGCLYRNEAFWWQRHLQQFPPTPRHSRLLALAASEGLRDGVTVPCCVRGQPMGSCSFSCPVGLWEPSCSLFLAQTIGAFAFAAARRITRGGLVAEAGPRLSRRQRECLILASQGKSDWDIGMLLGLRPKSVKHYLEAAKARFGVKTRVQLALCALYYGEIALTELAPRLYGQSAISP